MIDTLNISERYLKAKTEEKKAKLIAHLFQEVQEEHLKNVSTKDDVNNLKELLAIKFNYLMWAIGALGALNVGVLFMLFDMIKCMPK